MKVVKKKTRKVLAAAMAILLGLLATGCDNGNGPGTVDPLPVVSIETLQDNVLSGPGSTIRLTATVENAQSSDIMWTSSDPTYVKVDSSGVVSVVKQPDGLDKAIVITATLKSDKTVTASVTVILRAKERDGEKGYLTDKMIAAIGGSNITVTGTYVDHHLDATNSANNWENKYFSTVKMTGGMDGDGKWLGSWYAEAQDDDDIFGSDEDISATNYTSVITNAYEKDVEGGGDFKGAYDSATGQYPTGHRINEVRIGINNEIERKPVTNYMSVPAIWEYQHYWNHLKGLSAVKFDYDVEVDPYKYEFEPNATDADYVDDLYLMSYLTFSLTPMLDTSNGEMFARVIFFVEPVEGSETEHKITKMQAQTVAQYTGEQTDKQGNITSYSTMDYTTCEFTFSDIDTTVITDPTPYEATENVDKLQAAFDKVKSADNFTFQALEKYSSRAESDPDDYTSSQLNAARDGEQTAGTTVNNYNHPTGKEGIVGYVTSDAVLLERTGMYSATMGDNVYHTGYTGYKQVVASGDDAYYEYFEYDYDGGVGGVSALVGKTSYVGTIADVLPKFALSANLFEYDEENSQGSKYVYRLREVSLTKDVARQMSMHSYASSAAPRSNSTMTITVNYRNNAVNTVVFAYPIVLDRGDSGVITTTIGNFGTTTIKEGAFNAYVEKGWRQTWSDYTVERDVLNPDYIAGVEGALKWKHESKPASEFVNEIWGSADAVPAPKIFRPVFGDDISGPWYHERERDGKTIVYLGMTARLNKEFLNDNDYIADAAAMNRIKTELDRIMSENGYSNVVGKTDISGGASGRNTSYLTYSKAGVAEIRIEFNYTKNAWIDFYKFGDAPGQKASD